MMEWSAPGWFWFGFVLFVIIALCLDTWADSKSDHPRGLKVSIYWTLGWISCAFIFNGLLWFYLYHVTVPEFAHQKALEFLTGYLIEESLSIDNLFVFYLIFHQFRIPHMYQHRVLSYGIWTAIVLRLILILFGIWVVKRFHWILYIFGGFLLLTGIKIFFAGHEEKELQESFIFRLMKRFLRMTDIHGKHFFIKQRNLIYVTPLFIALIFIEISDLIFAMDSIPAIFAITLDPFIVWTSNIFAILGLRSLYLVLAHMVSRFRLLKYGVALILIFVGSKMIVEPWIKISVLFSLGFIAGILGSFILISLFLPLQRRK